MAKKHALPIEGDPDVSPPPQKKKKKKRTHEDTKPDRTTSNGKGKSDAVDGSDESSYVESRELAALPQSTIDEFLTKETINADDPSGNAPLRPMLSFDHLPSPSSDMYDPLRGFPKPTPIQSATWPLLFSGRDVIGVAETGSGKTIAFGLPCLRRILELKKCHSSSRVYGAIITPTRELAMQIYDQLTKFAPTGISVACIYGGASKDDQRRALKKASIVVATPGRLKDLLSDQSVNLKSVQYLVLDEADRMLDKGFEQDIRDIIGATAPAKKRQTVMFTATWPVAVRNLAATFTTQPVTVTIGDAASSNELRANIRIKQMVEVLNPYDKEQRLLALLRQYQSGKNKDDRILIFCLYKKEAMRIERLIRNKGLNVAAIHGDMNQADRFTSLNAFKSGAVKLLVATDVAARGLDIPAVKLVLNVTFPLTVEDYVHRIGR